VPNFTDAKQGYAEITPENEHLLRTAYEARRPEELPVLVRYFESGSVEAPRAEYLDVILYSREQIRKENEAMGDPPQETGALYSASFVVEFHIPLAHNHVYAHQMLRGASSRSSRSTRTTSCP
jgi:hypothetical protein